MRCAGEDDFVRLTSELGRFEGRVLEFVAIEVAKEFADFHAREELH